MQRATWWAPVAAICFIHVLLPPEFFGQQEIAVRKDVVNEPPLCLVIMDPLASRLSCPCVEGYAQRDYNALAAYLETTLRREVRLGFGESMEAGLKSAGCGRADIVIGKDSVVRADGAKAATGVEPICALADENGDCTTRGLFVVPADDAAESVGDVLDYAIYIGTSEHSEKHGMALDALREAGLPEPYDVHEVHSCSDAAAEILELVQPAQAVAVISSYAEPLLEGCGTVPKGALRVIGETEPVRFITAFVSQDMDYGTRDRITQALLHVGSDAALCKQLESSEGFVRPPDHVDGSWPGWRGPSRSGHAPELPARLPEVASLVWSRPLSRSGLGGLAATRTHLVMGDRDEPDSCDVFRCFDTETGELLWEVAYDAPGNLDYGNSPRATPLIENGRVHLLGAMGDLHCVDLYSGEILWRRNLIRDFAVPKNAFSAWGYCSSPLVADGRLIISPGAPEASVVALNPANGEEVWRSPGRPPGYGSFVAAYPGGRCQVIGFDESTLGGWDVATGDRLWTVEPEVGGGFNVPTPVVMSGDRTQFLVSTETDGTRLYELGADGVLICDALAKTGELSSEMATPVVIGSRVFCVQDRLVELDASDGLATVHACEDVRLGTYAALISGSSSVLAIGNDCQLLMYDITRNGCRLVSDVAALEEAPQASHAPVYAHPAIVGTRMFIRGPNELACIELVPDGEFDGDEEFGSGIDVIPE